MKILAAQKGTVHPAIFLALVATMIVVGGLNLSLRYASAHPQQAEKLFATTGSILAGSN